MTSPIMKKRESGSDGSGRRQRISFHDSMTTSIKEIPLYEEEDRTSLFYDQTDYQRFQAKEQQRYDKMMMKKIQHMVRMAMADTIEEATKNGATPEEIDALMPQTPEAIFDLLGSEPGAMDLFTPKQIHIPKDDAQLVAHKQQQQQQRQKEAEEEKMDKTLEGEEQTAMSVEMDSNATETSTPVQEPKEKIIAGEKVSAHSSERSPSSPKREDLLAAKKSKTQHGETTESDNVVSSTAIANAIDDPPITDSKSVNVDCTTAATTTTTTNTMKSVDENTNEEEIYSTLGIHCDIGNGGDKTPNESLSPPPTNATTTNDELNDVLGTSFSAGVHVEDLVPHASASASASC